MFVVKQESNSKHHICDRTLPQACFPAFLCCFLALGVCFPALGDCFPTLGDCFPALGDCSPALKGFLSSSWGLFSSSRGPHSSLSGSITVRCSTSESKHKDMLKKICSCCSLWRLPSVTGPGALICRSSGARTLWDFRFVGPIRFNHQGIASCTGLHFFLTKKTKMQRFFAFFKRWTCSCWLSKFVCNFFVTGYDMWWPVVLTLELSICYPFHNQYPPVCT